MAKMTTITCLCGCGRQKEVRTADVQRGWGKFYSKSCKARYQTRNQFRNQPKNSAKKPAPPQRRRNELDSYEDHEVRYNRSIARSSRLYCSECKKPIRQNTSVLFVLKKDTGRMTDVFCAACSDTYSFEEYADSIHPFSEEAFGK